MKRGAILVACLLLAWRPAAAENGAPAITLISGEDPEQLDLLVYDSRYCNEASSTDCPLASLSCDSGSLWVNFENVDNETLSRWLMQKGGMTLSLAGISAGSAFHPTEILMNETTGNWSVGFLAQGSTRPLTIPNGANELVFDALPGRFAVPLVDDNRSKLEKFVAACP